MVKRGRNAAQVVDNLSKGVGYYLLLLTASLESDKYRQVLVYPGLCLFGTRQAVVWNNPLGHRLTQTLDNRFDDGYG